MRCSVEFELDDEVLGLTWDVSAEDLNWNFDVVWSHYISKAATRLRQEWA